jgi:hypothetical protein
VRRPQHFLNFSPLPHGQGWFRPIFGDIGQSPLRKIGRSDPSQRPIRSASPRRILTLRTGAKCGAGTFILASSAFRKAAVLRQGGGITRAVQNADDNDLAFVVQVVEGVIARKTDTQPRRKILARGRSERKMPQRFAILLDPVDEPRGYRLGSLDGNIEPDFGEVGFRSVGQAEGERSANSFLPRSTMRAASKFLTRPAATSARPASISALRAANSSI